jgi:predicted DNA-binding transcriptional regulator AlpA
MTPTVNTEDLIDAQGVAELLGLSQRNSVSGYQRRYPDMPKPVVNMGQGRPMLWLRHEIDAWIKLRGPVHPGRPRNTAEPLRKPSQHLPTSPGGNRPPLGGASGSRGGGKRESR